jgi:uncharacterized protein YodC (DUF2158 family)
MEDVKFEIGDTVYLKSGGPLMTVYKVTDNYVSCEWFPTHEKTAHSDFNKQTVIKQDQTSI